MVELTGEALEVLVTLVKALQGMNRVLLPVHHMKINRSSLGKDRGTKPHLQSRERPHQTLNLLLSGS